MPEERPREARVTRPQRTPGGSGTVLGRQGGSQSTGHWAPIGFSQRGAAGRRLSNLVKLYYVPIHALRGLLESRSPTEKLNGLRQADLVRKADELPAISEADVDKLYENSRYGQRLTFYLYLLPTETDELDVEELQSVLDRLVIQDQPCRLKERCACREYECETCPHQVKLLDEEHWNGFREIRYRYYVSHRFLNADEQPDEVLQSRYGFLWLDPARGSLAILTRDEMVNGLLTRALAQCLQATPQPVRFPKELLDKHFSIEKAKHLSYYDPSTGVRRCLSGRSLWQRFEREVMARELEFARPNSLYEEEIAQGLVSGLGVIASKGKIYLTRTLPTSVVRTWARQRLPDLMQDVKEVQAYQPATQSQPEAVQRMRLHAAGRDAINTVVDGLLQIEREDLTSVSLPKTALEVYDALSGRYFTPYVRTQCGECEHLAELCPHCESEELGLEVQKVVCQHCGAVLSEGDSVMLACMDGHVTTAPKAEALNIAPNHWFQKRIARIFAEMGKVWDERNDYFHIEGNTLYRLRKGRTEREALHPVVQNYISNFWDPVTGQVHAGSGDIVTIGGNGHSTATPAAIPPTPLRPARGPVAEPMPMAASSTATGAQRIEPPGTGASAPSPVAQGKEGEKDMLKREDIRPTVTYTPTFHGPIYGPTHTGSGNIQVESLQYGLQAEDLNTLFESLTRLVEQQAPAQKKPEALQQVGALKQAIQAAKPDVNRMESVLNWFKRHIPELAGAVTSVIVNPIVGRLVEAAGEIAVEEFRRRFGR